MSHRYRHRGSTSRQVAWYLTALAAVGAVALADELLRHGLLTVLALAGPVAGYAAGRVHGRRLRRQAVQRHRANHDGWAEILPADRDESRQPRPGVRKATTGPGEDRARLLADPRSGARPLSGPR